MSKFRDEYLANGSIRPATTVVNPDELTPFHNVMGWPLMELPNVRTPPERSPPVPRKRARRHRRKRG